MEKEFVAQKSDSNDDQELIWDTWWSKKLSHTKLFAENENFQQCYVKSGNFTVQIALVC